MAEEPVARVNGPAICLADGRPFMQLMMLLTDFVMMDLSQSFNESYGRRAAS